MSWAGVRRFAALLTAVQEARTELIRMGSQSGSIDTVDIRLGQLAGKMNDAVKGDFMRLVDENVEEVE